MKLTPKVPTPEQIIAAHDSIDHNAKPNIYDDNGALEDLDCLLPLVANDVDRTPLLDGANARYKFWHAYYGTAKDLPTFELERGSVKLMKMTDALRYRVRVQAMLKVAMDKRDLDAAEKIMNVVDRNGQKVIEPPEEPHSESRLQGDAEKKS